MAFDKPQSRNEAILQNMLGANNELEPPKSRVEALLQDIAGQMPEANPSEGTTTGTLERLKIGDDIYTVEGGGSGTSDYDALNNKPQIAGVTLSGDKSLADLGIASATAVSGILDGTDIDSFGDVETALGDKVDKVEGKGLSTNDYDDTEKAAVAAATTAIAGIKDGTTIDSFADVETALADKQDATDNSLETEAKTIVGAINENASDIGQLKSGLTNVESKIDDATVYHYADVITIEDAVPSNLADCSVKIEPIQDLHGYDKPWVGGASKNKLPMDVDVIKLINTSGTWNGNVYSENGTTATVLTDNDGNVTGFKVEAPNTPSSTFIFNVCYQNTELSALENVSVTMNGCPANGSSDSYAMQFYLYNGSENVTEYGSGVTFTPSNLSSGSRIRIVVKTATPSGGLLFYPMIRLATETDATFAPYTNICPISGHTEVDVQRDGDNFLNTALFNDGTYYTANADGTITQKKSDNRSESNISTLHLPAGTYTFDRGVTAGGLYVYTQIDGEWVYFVQNKSNALETFTLTQECDLYIKMSMMASENYPVTFSAGIYQGTLTQSHFVPYAGKTYTIALGSTIYGGTVDFDSGVMTVDRAFVEYDGSNDENWNYDGSAQYIYITPTISGKIPADTNTKWDAISNYLVAVKFNDLYVNHLEGCGMASSGNIAAHISGVTDITTDIATIRAYLSSNPLQVCYELATTTTIQLTPQQIQLLKGQNTITASTGQISVTVNGVSGSIGSVQEQVNELAEDVAEIKPVNYSTTEQKTGQKWIDGNDIYFKAIDIGALPNATNKDVLTNITNIRDVVRIDGIATNGTIYTGIPHGANIAQYGVEVSYDKTSNYVRVSTSEDQSSYTGVIIIYYTKTA